MASIYQEAYKVAVWLVPQVEGSDRVMAFLQSLHEAEWMGDTNFMDQTDSMPEVRRRELQAFFDRSCWTRVWVIQEIVVGSQVSIMCGRDVVKWESLSEAVSTPLFCTSRRNLQLEKCHRLCNIRSKDVLGAPMSLLEALYATSLLRSTERKDKVFGLLGLTIDKRVYLTEPQYAWSEYELCIRMTQSYNRRKRSLNIIFVGPYDPRGSLNDPHSADRNLRLSSWCPKYTCFPATPELRHLISYVSGQDEKTRTGELGRRWNATDASIAMKETYHIDSNNMWVKALSIGTVAALGIESVNERPQVLEEPKWQRPCWSSRINGRRSQ